MNGGYPITYGSNPFGTGPGWAYTGTACGFNLFLLMTCTILISPSWRFQISLGPGPFGDVTNSNPIVTAEPGFSCSPPNFTFNITGLVCVALGMGQNVAVTVTL